MELAAPETAAILLGTVLRGAALAVLATEALFLWMRRREAQPSTSPLQSAARVLWALTPAVLLAGLSFWCLASMQAAPDRPAQSIAQLAPR